MPPVNLDDIAESFVKLTLALGQHDQDYVDSYFGPEEWKEEVVAQELTLDQIIEQARALSSQIAALPLPADDAMLIHTYGTVPGP